MSSAKRLCLVPRIPGIAGPANFQRRLAAGLARRGVGICYDLADRPYQAVLVIGGTRNLIALWRARREGIPVVQRLNGMNWIHRRRRTGLHHFLRAEANNVLLRLIRDRLAGAVVYQSRFAQNWWERTYGPAPAPAHVVYNGVPLESYNPNGREQPPSDRWRLLVVEGNLAGGYEVGLEPAIGLGQRLQELEDRPIEVVVAGRAPQALKQNWESRAGVPLRWLDQVAPDAIPALDRSAHLLYAADLNPACPNTVLEALACGLPVVAFATGALPELVTGDAGRLAAYGGDPWRLDAPDVEALGRAAQEVLHDQARFRPGARACAEAAFGLEPMVDGYLRAFGWDRSSP